jgi:multidrug resistance efflux pump
MKKVQHVEVIDNDIAAQRQLQRARAEAKAAAAAEAAGAGDGEEVKESKADTKMAQRLKDSEKQMESAREKVDEAEQKYKQLIRDVLLILLSVFLALDN